MGKAETEMGNQIVCSLWRALRAGRVVMGKARSGWFMTD